MLMFTSLLWPVTLILAVGVCLFILASRWINYRN